MFLVKVGCTLNCKYGMQILTITPMSVNLEEGAVERGRSRMRRIEMRTTKMNTPYHPSWV